jgi:hypothetical protein
LLRLEAVQDARRFRHLSDEELDATLRAALAEWLATDPDACPREIKCELLAFVAAHDEEGAAR